MITKKRRRIVILTLLPLLLLISCRPLWGDIARDQNERLLEKESAKSFENNRFETRSIKQMTFLVPADMSEGCFDDALTYIDSGKNLYLSYEVFRSIFSLEMENITNDNMLIYEMKRIADLAAEEDVYINNYSSLVCSINNKKMLRFRYSPGGDSIIISYILPLNKEYIFQFAYEYQEGIELPEEYAGIVNVILKSIEVDTE